MSTSWQTALSEATTSVLYNIFAYIPVLFSGIIVFIIGLFLAKWLKKIVVEVFTGLKLETFFKKIGAEKFLQRAEINLKIEEILGNIVKWLIIFVFFIATVNILGLQSVSTILDTVLAYIPKVLSAVFILAATILLAGLVESLVKGSVGQIDLKLGRLSGKLSSYLVVIFGLMAAINELGIAQTLINILFIGIVSMFAIGFGLAIGLGTKDLVADVLSRWYEKIKREIK